MKKFTLSRITDTILKIILVFFIFFVWIRFYQASLYLSLFYTALATIIVVSIFIALQNKRYTKQNVTKEETNFIKAYTNEFLFSTSEVNLQFFLTLVQKKHKAFIKSNFILIPKQNYMIALFPYYKTRKLDVDTLTNIYIEAKQLNVNKLIITCKSYEQEVLNLAKQITNLKLVMLEEKLTFFKLLKPYEHYPQIEHKLIEEKKLTTSQIMHIMFHRKKAKGYIISGTVLLLGSFVIRYNLYYIIFATILYFMALFSFFNLSFNKKITENILEDE